jgi:hypothetical protein
MCLPHIVARQRLDRHFLMATITHNNRRIFGGVVLSMKAESVGVCIPLSLLGNGSVNTFLRQRRIVGGVFFYPVHVVSKESRRLFFQLLVLNHDNFRSNISLLQIKRLKIKTD